MTAIRAKDNPELRRWIRQLAQDDGGDQSLDRVDGVTEVLLNNTVAAYNKAEAASGSTMIVTISAVSYDPPAQNCTIVCNGGSNTVTINLPSAAACLGRIYNIKAVNIDNAVTVEPSGAELIESAPNYTFPIALRSITIQSDGSGWWMI